MFCPGAQLSATLVVSPSGFARLTFELKLRPVNLWEAGGDFEYSNIAATKYRYDSGPRVYY